ncbi:hypothetical protein Gorai_019204 [Gossypium raimondii]|uniref:Uncharacterized protein n=1 Tax=Gossypium raimondii TaxID=29730 RepID=A0A7J8PMI6_GOSRA|nr:hypothetical protein [Gossypium raimondii]
MDKGVMLVPLCSRCGGTKDLDHVILMCPKAQDSWVHANCVFDAAQLATVVYHQPSSRIVAGDLNMIVHTRGRFDCVKQGVIGFATVIRDCTGYMVICFSRFENALLSPRLTKAYAIREALL